MSHMELEDGAGDLKTSDVVSRPGSTGTAKHGRHGGAGERSDWATTTKAVKEPAYRGPRVSSEEDVAGVMK